MSHVFSPEIIEAMGAALDRVCGELNARGHSKYSREIIADRIICLVLNGETDPDTLAKYVLSPPLFYRVRPNSDRCGWEVLRFGKIVKSGVEPDAVQARAAGMLAAVQFKLS
jgi:hypothetical protein